MKKRIVEIKSTRWGYNGKPADKTVKKAEKKDAKPAKKSQKK